MYTATSRIGTPLAADFKKFQFENSYKLETKGCICLFLSTEEPMNEITKI